MTQQEMIEGVKLIGSVVGLITGAFVLFDRFARGRPRIWISADRLGAHAHATCCIRNFDSSPIFIRGIACSSSRYGFARDTSVREIVKACVGDRLDASVAAGETLVTQMIKNPGALVDEGETAGDGLVRIKVSWRRASSPELWQVPVFLFFRPSRVEEIEEAAAAA